MRHEFQKEFKDFTLKCKIEWMLKIIHYQREFDPLIEIIFDHIYNILFYYKDAKNDLC